MNNKNTQGSEKVAISLPRSLLDEMEKVRKKTGESRSSFIQRAIRAVLEGRERLARVEKYVSGYKQFPETEDEVKAAEAAATYLLAEEPWE